MSAQILKLGLSGAETTLESKSRSFTTSGNVLNAIEGRSADGTLHSDFITSKKTFEISYSVLSEATKDILTNIYLLQISTPSFLSFVYTDESGAEITTTVRMEAPEFGAINPKGTYYYNGVSLFMEEV